jgi:hypothetical protein
MSDQANLVLGEKRWDIRRHNFLKVLSNSMAMLLYSPMLFLERTRRNIQESIAGIGPYKKVYAWKKTILVISKDKNLIALLDSLADKFDKKITLGDQNSPDLVAIPNFVSIVDLNYLTQYQWEFYLAYRKEVDDETTPVIVMGDSGTLLTCPGVHKVERYNYGAITEFILQRINDPIIQDVHFST